MNGKNAITHAKQQIICKANEYRERCHITKDLITKCLADVKVAGKRQAHLIVIQTKGQDVVREAKTMCSETEQCVQHSSFCFGHDNRIAESLNAFDSLAIEVEPPTSSQISVSPTLPSTVVQTIVKYTIGQKSEINLKSSGDKQESDIVGTCLFDNGTIVLADNQHSRLTHVSSCDNKVIGYCDLGTKPWGVCSIGPQQVAVSCSKMWWN